MTMNKKKLVTYQSAFIVTGSRTGASTGGKKSLEIELRSVDAKVYIIYQKIHQSPFIVAGSWMGASTGEKNRLRLGYGVLTQKCTLFITKYIRHVKNIICTCQCIKLVKLLKNIYQLR